MPELILKRDGTHQTWNPEKIVVAVTKAMRSDPSINYEDAPKLAKSVTDLVLKNVNGNKIVDQEYIQDLVENALMEKKFFSIAKKYIKYREKRREVRTQKSSGEDIFNLIDSYIERDDWRVQENANIDFSFQGLTLNLSGTQQAIYCLNKMPEEIQKAHKEGFFHIHDLSFGLAGYCFSGDTKIQTEEYGLISFDELKNLNVNNLKVASFKDGELIFSDAEFLGVTRENTEVIEIEFEDGYKVKCTPDHKFLLKNGEYKEARLLTEQDDIECLQDYKQMKIVSIKNIDKKMDVFDINVKGTHNFILENGIVVHNCAGWSLFDIILEGFNKSDACSSNPPKHFDTVLTQVVNFIGTLQNEWAGAMALNNVDTLCAPFIYYDKMAYKNMLEEELNIKISEEKIDKLFYKRVKQGIQRFIFNMNTTSRWGGQCPFSNITLDLVCPKHMSSEPAIVGGKAMDKTYSEFQKEMDMFNKALLEVMSEGDSNGRIFSFPIPTYNVTKDFPWDSEIGNLLLKMTAKYGIPYFQNFLNSNISPEDIRSMCCRLQLDKNKIKKQVEKKVKTGGLFGSGDLTGSIGVVTINLPKLGYLAAKTSDPINKLFELIERYMDLAKTSLELKRKMLEKNLELGMYPWTKRYLKNGFHGHFSTIGLVGGHEMCLNLLGVGIETEEGTELVSDVLDFMLNKLEQYEKETDNIYNLEATPAEGTSYRLAKIDKKLCPDIIQSGEIEPYYTNSTQLPVDYTKDVFFALNHQNKLQTKYTGGTVFHTFIGEAASDIESLKNFILKALTMTKLPYLSITPTFSICNRHGYLNGEQKQCPECGSETEVYTRIVGYYRPISRWNKGKQSEYCDRIEFKF